MTGNTTEPTLNTHLAHLLRRMGLEAESEQRVRDAAGKHHQIDVLIELDDDAIALEAEFAPASSVRDDAIKRLQLSPLYWRGLPVTSAFTVVYPESMQRIPESDAADELASTHDLAFAQIIRSDRTQAIEWGPTQTGSVRDLAETLHNFWVRTSQAVNIQDTVDMASQAIATAAETLARAPSLQQIEQDSDPPATCALIWLNALLFQEILAKDLLPETLPPPHTGCRIPCPQADEGSADLLQQWDLILSINWYPIFDVARKTLAEIPSPLDVNALAVLKPCAKVMAENQAIRRHDVMGRIFHRLLESRRYLATNYTTIPAAVLLAGLAFDDDFPLWRAVKWDDAESLGKSLRIVDPACGSGTLLMAATQEILKRLRRTQQALDTSLKAVLENSLIGFDVVPGAVHLTATTLSMAETRQVLKGIPIYRMPHDVNNGIARLGSLDFLRKSSNYKNAQSESLFPDPEQEAVRVTGTGEQLHDSEMSYECDLIISNPPYTRAGGPGGRDNTSWNPLFGSVLSSKDQKRMNDALRKTLDGTPASLYAGLGSAFVTLANEHLKIGGRLAFVLPATVLTGSRWSPIRELLLDRYDVEWVVVSHDSRNRTARAGLPGRRYVAFSESTRIAETLIVATRRNDLEKAKGWTRFVNLRRIPDEPIAAMGLTRALLASRMDDASKKNVECSVIDIAGVEWGEIITVRQQMLDAGPWAHTTFTQSRLATTTLDFIHSQKFWSGQIPLTTLGTICDLGPSEMQIKNPTQGLFDIVETDDPTSMGEPAVWHHSEKRMKTLKAAANAKLRRRKDKSREEQDEMLGQASRLHIARELGHAPQRLAAIYTEEPMLGVRSWISLKMKNPRDGAEEVLCLWLNSTLGLLLRLVHANRPYLGRSGLTHELAQTLRVIDTDRLTDQQLQIGKQIFADLADNPLTGFANLTSDPVRRELDHRLMADLLALPDEANTVEQLAKTLAHEPLLTTRH